MDLRKILAVSIIGAAVVACSSVSEPIATNETHVAESSPLLESPAVVEMAPVVETVPVKMARNSINFDFNKYNIDGKYANLLKANSDYLIKDGVAKVQVQGNTDDIGSAEYNIALGQKRADAVKKVLVANGAKPEQVDAISNGKLKPKFVGNTEDARAQNRRADIIYQNDQPKDYNLDSNGLPMMGYQEEFSDVKNVRSSNDVEQINDVNVLKEKLAQVSMENEKLTSQLRDKEEALQSLEKKLDELSEITKKQSEAIAELNAKLAAIQK